MNDTVRLQPEITELLDLLQEKDERIQQLEAMILQLRKQQFGTSSEKLSPDQLALFDEAEETAIDEEELADIAVEGHTRKAKKRVSIPSDLPREDIIHDLPDEQKICPHDGTPLKQFGEETSEQLDIIPAQIKVLRHVRLKYVCPCCEQHLVTASKPRWGTGNWCRFTYLSGVFFLVEWHFVWVNIQQVALRFWVKFVGLILP